jgi:hypothetical protein
MASRLESRLESLERPTTLIRGSKSPMRGTGTPIPDGYRNAPPLSTSGVAT